MLFHHSPVRTDDQLDRILDGVESPVPTVVAREGMRLPVGVARDGAASEPAAPHLTTLFEGGARALGSLRSDS